MSLILVAGMRRSGSTVAFQIALELVGGKEHSLAFDKVDKLFLRHDKMMVGKTHSFWKQAERDDIVVINTYRDPRDIVCSVMQMYGYPGGAKSSGKEVLDRGWIKHAVHHQELWEKSSANRHEARYEDFVDDLFGLVCIIARAIGMDISREEAERIADKYSLERNRQRSAKSYNMRPDLIFPGHTRDGQIGKWKWYLTENETERIYEFAGDWMAKRGYI